MVATVKKLVVDFPTGTYTMTIGDTTQTAPIRSKATAAHVAGLLKYRGFSIQIIKGALPRKKKGTPDMALTPTQQAEVDLNHFNAITTMLADPAAKIHGNTTRALQRRGFADFAVPPAVTQQGIEFHSQFAESHAKDIAAVSHKPPNERARHVFRQVDEPSDVGEQPADVTDLAITPPAAAQVAQQEVMPVQPDNIDAYREMVIELRQAALNLGRALAVSRVPELEDLFSVIQRSDELLFKD